MAVFKRKDGTGGLIQAMPIIHIMRIAQINPMSLPQWMLSAYQEGRISATYEAFFVRQDKGRRDDEVKIPSDHWLVETSPNHLEGMSQQAFDAVYELVHL